MKKLLSIFLALAMLASLLPAVYAAEGDTANFTVKYNLGDSMAAFGMDSTNTTSPFANINYDYTNGFYKFVAGSYATPQSSTNYKSYKNHMVMRNTLYIAFEIDVPVKATYTMNVDHGYRNGAVPVNVYINEGEFNSATYKYNEQPFFGAYVCNYGTANGFTEATRNDTVMNGESPASITLNPGKYVVTFMTSGAWADYKYGSVGNFSLVSGDGNGSVVVGSISGEKTVSAGESITLTASGYYSNTGMPASSEDFVFSTQDTDIVTVSANGKVTGKAPGTAVIYASAPNTAKALSYEVTVPDKNSYTIKYDLSGDMTALGMINTDKTTNMSVLNYTQTKGFYNYVKSLDTVASNYFVYFTTHIYMRSGRYVSFEVDVPVKGTYTMNVDHGYRKGAYPMNVYIEKGAYNASTYQGSNGTLFGSYACEYGNANGFVVTTRNSDVLAENGSKASIELDAGKHVITFCAGGTWSGGNYASVGSFSLVSGDGNGAALIGSISGDTIIKEGATGTLSAEAYLSTTREEVSDVVFTSGNTDVFTVTPQGVITAVGPGTAKVYATSKKANIPLSADITVSDSNSFTVKYDIGGVMIKTGINDTKAASKVSLNAAFDYNTTNGFFKYVGIAMVSADSLQYLNQNIRVNENLEGLMFEIYVPRAGTYTMRETCGVCSTFEQVDVYVSKTAHNGETHAETLIPENYIGYYDCTHTSKTYGAVLRSDYVMKNESEKATVTFDAPGYYVVTFDVKIARDLNRSSIGTFELISGDGNGTVYMGGAITAGKTMLTVGDGTTATVKGYKSDATEDETAVCSAITSSDTSVITVSNGLVKAVGAGKANLEATVNGAPTTLEITVSDADAPSFVTLATSNNTDNSIKVVGNTYTRGQSVTVIAEEIPGYTFRHWVRGTVNKGEWVSSEKEYTFNLVTNTFLTAVYTPNVADGVKIVEFFNGNGEYITEKNVADGAVELPANPKLTGFEFKQWIVNRIDGVSVAFKNSDITDTLTRVVAEFDDSDERYTVDGVSGLKYDEEVMKNSADGNSVAWYRDGKLVGYGESYAYRVWSDVGEITQGEFTSKKPVVYMDPVSKGSARMVEYDAGDKEIVEVGILFGNGSNMTVDSCMYKATSQKNGRGIHGQFTACPADDIYTTAIGYLIYKDGNTYKVVYAD